MDYEKRYKEMKARVLEIGQGYVKGVDFSKPRQIAEYICPELGESEDERIRKAIINVFASHKDYENFYGASVEEILAWLEKQNSNADNANKEYWRGYREGKQEVIDKYAELEKQGEEKPTDKFEPKFKIGDWVIFNNHHESIYQVEKIENYRYYLRHYLGGLLSVRYDTDLIRLWTIQDAKDGDVLAGEYDDDKKPWVGIFKCISENRPQTQFDSYCFITTSRHEFITPDSCDFCNRCKGHTIRYTKPATKEQRDVLFQKMHEAGYEWDAERKELKELSQSEVTKMDDQEQKPAWSEEDEERYLSCLKRLGTGDIRQPETINTVWLKSIKDRVQPKQELSEEDEEAIRIAIIALDDMYDPDEPDSTYLGYSMPFNKASERLESLKDRIK